LTKYFVFLALLFIGCEDKAIVHLYDKEIVKSGVPCVRLVIFPPDKKAQNILEKLYSFSDKCDFKLEISKKSGITCNSNQNSDKKALTNFPSSYLKMDVSKDRKVVYSYYVDLLDEVDEQNYADALLRVRKDLNMKVDDD
jgi:hypothetical protein